MYRQFCEEQKLEKRQVLNVFVRINDVTIPKIIDSVRNVAYFPQERAGTSKIKNVI